MRVTTKGQVTIPRNIRESLGIIPETDIDFKEENGRFLITRDVAKFRTYFPQVKLIHPNSA